MSLNKCRIAIGSALGIVLLGTVFVSTAGADCGYRGTPNAALLPQSWQGSIQSGPSLLLATDRGNDDRIVGFWKVKMVSEGSVDVPDGTVIDIGFAQWHSDGTEFTDSQFAPATGNICLGVWQRVGPSTYTLNHFGWGFDAATGAYTGPSQIRQDVVVDRRGNRYEGSFTLDLYNPSGTLLQQIVGRVTATRITINTTIRQVL